MPATESFADARPTKQFFIASLTRDLSLEDAVLDLVDNAIDSLILTRELDVSPLVLLTKTKVSRPQLIEITVMPDKIEVVDRCGGISYERAEQYVFRLGRADGGQSSTLGVYGIGLKRALFKMGKQVHIESRAVSSGFRMNLDVPTWAAKADEWRIPIEKVKGAASLDKAGTTIRITHLYSETSIRISDGTLLKRLKDTIATTYSLFLSRFLSVTLNGTRVEPTPLPLASSEQLPPAYSRLSLNGVTVELLAGLAERKDEEWNQERAGWYVLCNGRVVVAADKTELTGWASGLPSFVPKFRGFVGIGFFFSKDPSSLPWTTSKRGLNRDSRAYLLARKEMVGVSKPVLSFLNSMYSGDAAEESEERAVAKRLAPVEVGVVVGSGPKAFQAPIKKTKKGKGAEVNILFKAARVDVDRIRKKVNRPGWSAGAVGKHTFDHFLRTEFAE